MTGPPGTLPRGVAGIGVMVASTVGFASMHGAVRYVSADLHPFEIAFFRNLFGLVALAPWFLHGGLTPLRTARFPLHCARAAINLVAMLMFFMGLSLAPIAQVQALGFTAPLFATLFTVVILRERASLARWLALAVGFAGTLVIVRPGIGTVDAGSLLTLASAATWALALVIIKQLSRSDSSVTITAWMIVLMTPFSLLPALFVWQWPDPWQWGWLLMIGVTGTLGQMGMSQAFRMADATAVLPFDFMKLVWGTIIGVVAFSELPDAWTYVGAVVVFSGGLFLALREHQAASTQRAAQRPAGDG